eukprot:949921_1
MSRSNVETSVDAPIDAVGDDAVGNVLDVTDDQPSHQEWVHQMFQKTPFSTFCAIAFSVWVIGIIAIAGTVQGNRTSAVQTFSHAFDGKDGAFAALHMAAWLVCVPFVIIYNCCWYYHREVASVVIVLITLSLLVAKPVYNNVYGGSVSVDPATHCTFLADE